jgi:hypothetical protein
MITLNGPMMPRADPPTDETAVVAPAATSAGALKVCT